MADDATQPMNVLHVIADQHAAPLMGCAGHGQAITPNMDRLAGEGVRFTRAYAQNPICTPSRVSILSGQYCHTHGYYGLSGPTPRDLPSLFGHFGAHGYRTAAFGKVHMPNDPVNWLARDVDRLDDSYETAESQPGTSRFLSYLEGAGWREWEDSWHNPWRYGSSSISDDARPSELPYEHTQEVFAAREAIRFIDEDPEKPFCLQVAFQKPHHPLLPQKRFWDMYPADLDLPETFDQDPGHRPPHFRQMWHAMRNQEWDYGEPGESFRDGARRAWRGTLACVTQIDDVLGMLLSALEQRGLAESTIVVYNSDHGCYHGMQGIVEKAPGICSDAVCRVPMIWRVPGVAARASVCHELVENVDLAATLPPLCGLPAMPTAQGREITGLLRGGAEPVRDVAVTENAWSKALHWGRWRFVHYDAHTFEEEAGELYDLEADPNESRNLYFDPDHAEVVAACRRRLAEWLINTTPTRSLMGGGPGDVSAGKPTSVVRESALATGQHPGPVNYL